MGDDLLVQDGGLPPPMANAEQLLVAGSSAGALNTIMNCDVIRARVPSSVPVRCLADSGWFLIPEVITPMVPAYTKLDATGLSLDPNHFPQNFEGLNELWTYGWFLHEPVLNQQCVAEHPTTSGKTWHCAVAAVAAMYTKTPLMVMQSAFDVWQINNLLFCQQRGSQCTSGNLLSAFGNVTRKTTEDWIKSPHAVQYGHALLLDKCSRHARSKDPAPFDVNIITQFHRPDGTTETSYVISGMQAVQQWMDGAFRWRQQSVSWVQAGDNPCPECCMRQQSPALPKSWYSASAVAGIPAISNNSYEAYYELLALSSARRDWGHGDSIPARMEITFV